MIFKVISTLKSNLTLLLKPPEESINVGLVNKQSSYQHGEPKHPQNLSEDLGSTTTFKMAFINATFNFTLIEVAMNRTEDPNLLDCDNLLHPASPLASVYFQTAVYSMYITIFIVALLGNVFVCYTVLSSPRMRTVTNYFIMNLAVGDMLITILCVPFTSVSLVKQYWPFGGFLCPVINYFQALSVFISAYTLVAISIDKYMVIMWPLKPRISKSFATCVIALVWLIAGATVLPTATFTTLVLPNETKYELCDRYICREDYSSVGGEYGVMYTQVLMVMQYVVPSVVLLFTYTSIAAVIWCHRIPGEAENCRDRRIARSKRKILNNNCFSDFEIKTRQKDRWKQLTPFFVM
nr:unnamed protein product [Callosobruchus chinensis]